MPGFAFPFILAINRRCSASASLVASNSTRSSETFSVIARIYPPPPDIIIPPDENFAWLSHPTQINGTFALCFLAADTTHQKRSRGISPFAVVASTIVRHHPGLGIQLVSNTDVIGNHHESQLALSMMSLVVASHVDAFLEDPTKHPKDSDGEKDHSNHVPIRGSKLASQGRQMVSKLGSFLCVQTLI
ncbi:unnamed protein product [Musa hybrid cultivar]